MDNRNKYALITGATSGIGFERARLLAQDGYNLLLVAREEERLQAVTDQLKQQYSIEVTPLVKDLFQTQAAREIYDLIVTVLLPGATDTGFFHKARQQDTVAYRETKLASPEEVAKDGYEALMRGENKIISAAKTKMHVFMSDLLGTKAAAANSRKQMESSDKANGPVLPEHQAAREERETITQNTGAGAGDLPKGRNSL